MALMYFMFCLHFNVFFICVCLLIALLFTKPGLSQLALLYSRAQLGSVVVSLPSIISKSDPSCYVVGMSLVPIQLRLWLDADFEWIPRVKRESFANRSFSVMGPRLWNDIPNDVKQCINVETFKKELKTFLFNKF